MTLLDGDVFKAGLDLATIAGPAIAMVTTFAAGLTKAVLRVRWNVAIQAGRTNHRMSLDLNYLVFSISR